MYRANEQSPAKQIGLRILKLVWPRNSSFHENEVGVDSVDVDAFVDADSDTDF